jgi:hypothetical protein
MPCPSKKRTSVLQNASWLSPAHLEIPHHLISPATVGFGISEQRDFLFVNPAGSGPSDSVHLAPQTSRLA